VTGALILAYNPSQDSLVFSVLLLLSSSKPSSSFYSTDYIIYNNAIVKHTLRAHYSRLLMCVPCPCSSSGLNATLNFFVNNNNNNNNYVFQCVGFTSVTDNLLSILSSSEISLFRTSIIYI